MPSSAVRSLAFALALTRWDGFFPALYGFLASLFWVATCFNWFIFQELSPQAGMQELLHRNWEWLLALFTGKASADNLIFVTQLALLGWWIGYLALWSLIRHQRLLHAVLPAGLALIVNAYFAPQNMTGFIILYLVAVLLLAIRVELARNETRWQLTRVRYAPDIALDFLQRRGDVLRGGDPAGLGCARRGQPVSRWNACSVPSKGRGRPSRTTGSACTSR